MAEKNAQVRIMDRIYSNAEVVIVWLGRESNDSHMIMELAERIDIGEPSNFEWEDAGPASLMTDLSYLSALYSSCTRPYWERTWILQELYLAQGEVVIICGLKQTTLSKLQVLFDRTVKNTITEGEAYPLVWGPRKEVPDFWNTLFTCTLRWFSSRRRPHETYLEGLLTKHKASLCSDPRDRVYALQNMTANRSIPVDYSMDLCELYWTVLARSQSADISFARNSQEALGLTTSFIRDCVAIGPYQDTRPILSGDAFFRSAPSTPSTRIGTIFSIEELAIDPASDKALSAENVRFLSTSSASKHTPLLTFHGIASIQVQPGD